MRFLEADQMRGLNQCIEWPFERGRNPGDGLGDLISSNQRVRSRGQARGAIFRWWP